MVPLVGLEAVAKPPSINPQPLRHVQGHSHESSKASRAVKWLVWRSQLEAALRRLPPPPPRVAPRLVVTTTGREGPTWSWGSALARYTSHQLNSSLNSLSIWATRCAIGARGSVTLSPFCITKACEAGCLSNLALAGAGGAAMP
uniref:Uncharacterized protein n=1 Tax=Solanum tuberosum TaxID=4113 RepID=M1DFT6_SOLTU